MRQSTPAESDDGAAGFSFPAVRGKRVTAAFDGGVLLLAPVERAMEICQRRIAARIEASKLGMDIRYVVTSLIERSAEYIYYTPSCPRGQAENLIKLHKTRRASGRTSYQM